MDNQITIIRAQGKRLTKTHTPNGSRPYDDVYLVESIPSTVDGIRALSERLVILQGYRDQAIIRGQRKASMSDQRFVRRAKYDDPERGRAGFEPVPRRWLCIDVDDLELPGGRRADTDPHGAITYTLSLLPDWLQGVTCHWQWSASMGVKGWGVVKAHIWVWLDRPVDDASLRAWARDARARGVPVDPALMNSVQIHYTALPVFEGMEDVMTAAGVPRALLVESGRDEASVPESVWDWSRLEEERRAKARQERAARPVTVTSSLEDQRRWTVNTVDKIRGSLMGAGVGDRHEAAKSAAGSLANIVSWGWLDEGSARDVLACSAIADDPKRDGELKRLWEWAQARATADPKDPPVLADRPDWTPRRRAASQAENGAARPAPPTDGDDGDLGDGLEGHASAWPDSDRGLGDRLVDRVGGRVRYIPAVGWLHYETGGVWRRDGEGIHLPRLALESASDLRAEIEAATPDDLSELSTPLQRYWQRVSGFARRAEDVGKVKAAVEVARVDPRVAGRVDDLDADGWMFGASNVAVHLASGESVPHDPSLMLTLQSPVPYDPDATCPLWERFIGDIMEGDAEMVAFLQRAAGYLLTASTREQCFFVLWGGGSNGKSTLLDVLGAIMGDYAKHAQFETFTERSGGGGEIRNDIADLRGARLVTAVEPNAGVKLDEGLIKQLTGGDPVKARFLYQEAFTFRPTFKVLLACNSLPLIRGTDHGIWRRVRLIPFLRRFRTEADHPADWPEADKTLGDRLKLELPGVLAWAVRGAVEWTQGGLRPPAKVLAATAGYRSSSDTMGRFLEDRCVLGPHTQCTKAQLFEAFADWCEEENLKVWAKPTFGAALAEVQGVSDDKVKRAGKQVRIWRGVGLHAEDT